jgi:hypothetical protein
MLASGVRSTRPMIGYGSMDLDDSKRLPMMREPRVCRRESGNTGKGGIESLLR